MRTEVVLVRHATSVVPTADGPDEFHRPLAPAGTRQALQLAPSLAASGPTVVWSSPYLRAVQTVEPAALRLGLGIQTSRELREWDDGLAFTPDWVPHYQHSWADPSHARPGGESLNQLTRRAVDAIRTLVSRHAGHRVLVGSHGTFVSRALYGFGQAVDWPFCHDMPMPAIYRLRFDERGELLDITGPGLPIDTPPARRDHDGRRPYS